MEILAPVNAGTLEAALEAGANAVYFGLRRLNARRGAKNFTQQDLPSVVEQIHAAGAKAHLTVNIDLDSRETGLAARTLQLAAQCQVDAVIIRDPALLALRPLFPELEFHLSTQAGVSSTAGVAAAQALGCNRVVLAREMTKEEIAAACRVPGIAIEVFAQGAMCFCASGRCLLSSWVGGRSGNRGACASPCRVGWHLENQPALHPLSMHDMCLVEHLPQLAQMGVASLKIEGRLKSAQWVSRAVRLYRHATTPGADLAAIRAEAEELGRYTGRALSDGYYQGHFHGLTDADAGRSSGTSTTTTPATAGNGAPPPPATPQLQVKLTSDAAGGTILTLKYDESGENALRIPPQRIASPKRAEGVSEMLAAALRIVPKELSPQISIADDLQGRLLPRRCAATIQEFIADFIRQLNREDDGGIRLPLKPEAAALVSLENATPCPENRRRLGDQPDRWRLEATQLKWFAAQTEKLSPNALPRQIVVEIPLEVVDPAAIMAPLTPQWRSRVILALPQVINDGVSAAVEKWCSYAQSAALTVEVNSWDTLHLAMHYHLPFESGNGLAILNPVAGQFLMDKGATCCAVSPEADQEQLEELSRRATVPLAITLFGRPALMTTRAQLPSPFAPEEHSTNNSSAPFSDARGITLTASRIGEYTLLRPTRPFDLRRCTNPQIRAQHLVLDLTGSPCPEEDLPLPPRDNKPFLFNYDRTLR